MAGARVIHFEITGKDPGALQAYYRELFGWKLDTSNPGGYGMTSQEETGVVVGIGGTPDGSVGMVTGYVTVADIEATLAKAARLGGHTVMGMFSPAPDTFLALVADPEGHVIGLTQV